MEEDKWDVDDSDLPCLTLLRPCSNSNKHYSPLIPGPAAKIQAAMRLHHSDDDDDDDDDFKSIAWLSALHFLQTGQTTTSDVVIPTTPLSCVINTLPAAIVDQVVAIIHSCTPNGLGDMTITLKDPTGIFDATIHRKVLAETDFAKDISVKAAIILKKVSIFAPSSKSVYLNITRSNVVKVFKKDDAPLLGNTNVVAPRVTYLPPDISKKSRILEDKFAQKQGRTKETMPEVCQVTTAGRSWLFNNQKRNGASFLASGNNEFNRDKNTSTQNEPLWARECGAGTEICEKAGNNRVTLDSSEKGPTSDDFSEGHKSSVFVGNLNVDDGDEVQQADKAVKQKSISKVSLPQWTDEQLDELYIDDDDEPLFRKF